MSPEQAEKIAFAALAELDALDRSVAEVVASWRPKDEDWPRVFVGEAATRARAGYEALWAHPPEVTQKGPHRVYLAGVTAADLRARTPAALAFPGGYLDIADQLVDGPWWWAFRLSELLGPEGVTWDGLVVLDDRVVFCPKPWRVLR